MRARAVTVASTPTLIASGGARISPDVVRIKVPTGGATVYVGAANVSTATGYPVAATETFEWSMAGEAIYGVVASSTQAVNIVEQGD